MTRAEKLEALLQRAIENGADLKLTPLSVPDYVKLLLRGSPWVEQLLFGNHDFARALFGDDPYYKLNDPKKTVRKLFEHHLQQAVISKDPIDYMYKEVSGDITDGIPEGNDIV